MFFIKHARVVELVDTLASGASDREVVQVQILFRVQIYRAGSIRLGGLSRVQIFFIAISFWVRFIFFLFHSLKVVEMNEQIQNKKVNPANRKKSIPQYFDKEGFFLSIGIGLGSFGIGLLITWAILTAPEGETNSTGFTLYQRLARQVPHLIQEKIALVLGVLFMLFGIALILLGLKLVVQFLIGKLKSGNQS